MSETDRLEGELLIQRLQAELRTEEIGFFANNPKYLFQSQVLGPK